MATCNMWCLHHGDLQSAPHAAWHMAWKHATRPIHMHMVIRYCTQSEASVMRQRAVALLASPLRPPLPSLILPSPPRASTFAFRFARSACSAGGQGEGQRAARDVDGFCV